VCVQLVRLSAAALGAFALAGAVPLAADGTVGGAARMAQALETLGVCRRGYFVEGLGGAQFALAGGGDPEAGGGVLAGGDDPLAVGTHVHVHPRAFGDVVLDDAGRPMVLINWNTDMGDGVEWSNAEDYPGYVKWTAQAYQMLINEVIYSLTH
jgi:hypothetical protein